MRQSLNEALGTTWEEWEIPRYAEESWSSEANEAHAAWWKASIGRQRATDASIARNAEFEYLYDKAYEDRSKVRVAGPFTVESISPHRTLEVDENGDTFDRIAEGNGHYVGGYDFATIILQNLKTAGVQQAHKEDRISFTSLTPWPGRFVCADGRYIEGSTPDDESSGTERRAAVFIGPEFGTVSRPDLVEAAREAGEAGFDVLIACAFNYDAHSTEFERLGRIPVLKARMNADLHMADDLKNTGKGNLFVIFGEPDIDVLDVGGDQFPGASERRRRVPPQLRRGAQRRTRRHRLLVCRYGLQSRELLRSPRIFLGRQRPIQVAQDHPSRRDQRGGMGVASQRHVAPLRQTLNWPHRREGHQPPRR